jgi:shikimate dehydrogenase
MKIYGLIGNPLTHSFSKKYFEDKFNRQSIKDCDYINFEIENLGEKIPFLRSDTSLRGLNVTIPYKTSILQYIDQLTPAAKEISACNCIKIAQDLWTGYNTDIIGFELSLKEKLKPDHQKALILGTGGSSKAVAYVLEHAGIDFLFVSREQKTGSMFLQYPMLSEDLLKEYTLVINTTPLGMYPHLHTFPQIPYDFLTPKHYCYDLVYNPEETLFLKKAKQQSSIVKNGNDMLVIQAEESWKIWNS